MYIDPETGEPIYEESDYTVPPATESAPPATESAPLDIPEEVANPNLTIPTPPAPLQSLESPESPPPTEPPPAADYVTREGMPVSAADYAKGWEPGRTYQDAPGYVTSRLRDPNETDPKYVSQRIIQNMGLAATPDNLAILKRELAARYPGLTANNDVFSFPGVSGNVPQDVMRDVGGPAAQWQFLNANPGPAPTLTARPAPTPTPRSAGPPTPTAPLAPTSTLRSAGPSPGVAQGPGSTGPGVQTPVPMSPWIPPGNTGQDPLSLAIASGFHGLIDKLNHPSALDTQFQETLGDLLKKGPGVVDVSKFQNLLAPSALETDRTAALSQLIRQGIAPLDIEKFKGQFAPSALETQRTGELSRLLARGAGPTPMTAAEFESIRAPIEKARRAQNAQAMAELANRGLLGAPGAAQGPETTAIGRIEREIAPEFATAAQRLASEHQARGFDLFNTALNEAGATEGLRTANIGRAIDAALQDQARATSVFGNAVNQAGVAENQRTGNILGGIQTALQERGQDLGLFGAGLGLAGARAAQDANSLAQALQGGGQYQQMTADIALRNLGENRQWQEFLANYGLDTAKVQDMITRGRTQDLVALLNVFMQGANANRTETGTTTMTGGDTTTTRQYA